MSVKLAYNRYEQFANTSGVPYAGAKLFTYVGGSVNTKQTTYTESTGVTPNTNPIVLDSAGQLPQPVWLTTGLSYKFVLAPSTDTDPPASPIWTLDGITGINDSTTSVTEWTAGPTPTFVSATSFTLSGDQTSTFAKSRRIRATVTAGTVYGTITNTAFAALTTVTVALDSGNLDSGLSAVSYSVVSSVNPSINADMVNRKGTAVASAATTDIWGIAGDYAHVTGNTGPITSFGTAPYAGAQRTVIFDSTPTITHNATTLQCPGAQSITVQAGDKAIVRADTTANMIIVAFERVNQPATTRGVLAVGRNIAARTNSGTPNTKLDITADEIQLEDANGNTFVAKTVSGTIDFGTVGANGIDTGTQQASTWYYGWVIAKADGTVSVLGSASSTAPTLPSGYTFKALATAARSSGATQFLKYRQFGNEVFFEASQNALAAGTSGVEASVSLTALIPPNAQTVRFHVTHSGVTDGSGVLNFVPKIRLVSGSDWYAPTITFTGLGAGAGTAFQAAQLEAPNLSQALLYLVTTTNGTVTSVTIDVTGFKLPLGGE